MLYPDNVPGPNGQPITPQEVQAKLEAVLKETQKSATVNAVGYVQLTVNLHSTFAHLDYLPRVSSFRSACLLPVTLTM